MRRPRIRLHVTPHRLLRAVALVQSLVLWPVGLCVWPVGTLIVSTLLIVVVPGLTEDAGE